MAYDGRYDVLEKSLAVRVNPSWARKYDHWIEHTPKEGPPFMLPKGLPAATAAQLEQLFKKAANIFRYLLYVFIWRLGVVHSTEYSF